VDGTWNDLLRPYERAYAVIVLAAIEIIANPKTSQTESISVSHRIHQEKQVQDHLLGHSWLIAVFPGF
jgi:hypothetical protein